MANSNFSIEKLTGRTNYNTWAFALKNYLLHEDLWDVVQSVDLSKEVDPKKDAKATAKIVLTIDTKLYVHIQDQKSARDTWNKLVSLFQDDGLDRRVGLVTELVSTKLVNCNSTEDYVTRIMTICHKLTNVGLVVSDEWCGIFMLAGLPTNYRPMIMGMEGSGKQITSDMVKTKLLQDVKMDKVDDDVALVTKQKSNKYKYRKFKKNFNVNASTDKQNSWQNTSTAKQRNQDKSNTSKAFCTVLSTADVEDDCWYIDSGATAHMSRSKEHFLQMTNCSDDINTAGKEKIEVVGTGLVKLNAVINNEQTTIDVHNVLYVPGLATNLLSVSQIAQNGHKIVFQYDKCSIFDESEKLFAEGTLNKGLYKFNEKSSKKSMIVHSKDSLELWHRRLGHASIQNIHKLQGMATGINVSSKQMDACVTCIKGKQHRLPFPKQGSRANELLELVHSDLCGPLEAESFRASRYFLTFKDDKSRKVFVYYLQFKSQVVECFLDFKARVEKQTGKSIKKLRTDNGKEYVNLEFEQILKKSGIEHQTTVPYTPEQNGVAERVNRTIVEKARCLLFEANLEKKFWAEAVNCAVYLINRTPTKTMDVTPEEAWSGKKPDLSHLRVFGTKALTHIPKPRRKKLDPKSEEAILVGYGTQTKGYRLFNPQTKHFYYSRDVTFLDESVSKHEHFNALDDSKSAPTPTSQISLEFPDIAEDEPRCPELVVNQQIDNGDENCLNPNKHNKSMPSTSTNIRRSERIKSRLDKDQKSSTTALNSDQCLLMLNL